MHRLAIIGVTGFGNVHFHDIKALVEAGEATCVAATVVNPDDAADQIAWLTEHGVAIYPDYRQMLQSHQGGIDLCFIPTGIHLHAPMTLAALEAGANVFVEKPAAALLRDVRAMQTASRAALKFVAVGYQHVYQPEVHALKHRLVDGALGRVIRLKCHGLWPRNSAYYSRNNWAGKLRVGDHWVLDSPFNNALSHYLNLMLFLAGRQFDAAALPLSVQAELYAANRIESPDTAAIRVRSTDNLEILFYVTHATPTNDGPHITIETDLCQIGWNGSDWTVTYHDTARAGEFIKGTPHPEMRQHLRRGVIGRLRDSASFIYPLDMAVMQTLVANAAHDSSPVQRLPEAACELLTQEDGNTLMTITGIADLIAKASRANKLFSEMGVAWGVAGREIDTRDYHGLAAAE